MTKPVVLGLTGSIGVGKSTTADMFREAGIPVWDADFVVDRLYAQGGAAVDPIKAEFPQAILDGTVNRAALKEMIKADTDVLPRLDAIVHPLVRQDRQSFLAEHCDQPIVVLDVPLLFETGLSEDVDAIVVVTVSLGEQRRRVLSRGNMSEEMFEIILAKQMPDAQKRARADYIIETTDMKTAQTAVQKVIKDLTP